MFGESLHVAEADTETRALERFAAFEATVSLAKDYHRRGRFDTAAYVHVAALMALRPHAGLFVSPREWLLERQGRRPPAVPDMVAAASQAALIRPP